MALREPITRPFKAAASRSPGRAFANTVRARSLLIALCLGVTLYVGFTSWWTADARLRPWRTPWGTRWRKPAAAVLALLLLVTGWLRTEGGLDIYANRLVGLTDATFGTALFKDCTPRDADGAAPDDCSLPDGAPKDPREVQRERVARAWWIPTFPLTHEHWLAGIWLADRETWNPLARTDLAGVEMVDLPEAWRTPDTARVAFRTTWCGREGLSMAVCDHPPSASRPAPVTLQAERRKWCAEHEDVPPDACLAQFHDLDKRFMTAWREERDAALGNLPKLNLSGTDLRNADAAQVSLVHARLVAARLGGANLAEARLEGADLSGAQLWEADLRGARLEDADLSGADLRGADVSLAQLEEANLGEALLYRAALAGANLEGANLAKARLWGANLSNARLEGANLYEAQLWGADLRGAQLWGAGLSGARLEGVDLVGARLDGAELRGAQLKGADLSVARLEGADLGGAELEGATLRGAQLEGANLSGARLKGADLGRSDLERADLSEARLQRTDLSEAQLGGANLRETDFRSSNWDGASSSASLAQFADFRGAEKLLQAQLDEYIGNGGTLLPEGPSDRGEPWYIWSCWETPPHDLNRLIATAAGPLADDADRADLRADFLCGPDNPRHKTGTPLALDAPYPEDHPLAGRD